MNASGSEVVVMTSGRACTKINKFCEVAVAPAESFTVNCRAPNGPGMFGVPEITPVLAFRESGNSGGQPPMGPDQVYGGTPPVACSVVEYALFWFAAGSDVVATVSVRSIARLLEVATVLSESVTSNTSGFTPGPVGVPVMPPPGCKVRPGGSEPDLIVQVNGGSPPVLVTAET